MKREEVIEKVKKLYRLSESDNPAEAQSAAVAAQRLVEKYHLEQMELGETPEEIIEQAYKTGQGNKWKYILSGVIAKNFRCRCYWMERKSKVTFVGYIADVQVAYETYDFLFTMCKRLAQKTDRKERERTGSSNGAGKAFALGFVTGVAHELGKQCTALMVITPPEVNQEYDRIKEEKGLSAMHNTFRRDRRQDMHYKDGEFAGRSAVGKRNLEVFV